MQVESKHWRPAHWSHYKRERTQKHVRLYAEDALYYFLGPYAGAKLVAELRGQARAGESLARLRDAGIRTLGEVG